MKQILKPALAALREIEELRAALNRRIAAISGRVDELSKRLVDHTNEQTPIARAKALIAGETAQREPEELETQRVELEKLNFALRETERPLQHAQTDASAEYCQAFIPAMFDRKRAQVALLKGLQKLNDESTEMTLEVHRAGFDLGGELRETPLFADDLSWHIENLAKDIARFEIEATDFGDSTLSLRMLGAGRTNGVNHQSGDLVTLPEKLARLAVLDSTCELVSPDVLNAARAAKIARIAA